MKKYIILITIIIVIICVISAIFMSCKPKEPLPPGWETTYCLYLDDLDEVRIAFGEDCIYPSKSKGENFKVNSEPPDNLWEYIGKSEYIPALIYASWDEKYYGIAFNVSLYKREGELLPSPNYFHEKILNNITVHIDNNFTTNYKRYIYTLNEIAYEIEFNTIITSELADAIIFDYINSMN